MNSIDYDQASRTYDNTRTFSDRIIEQFSKRVSFLGETTVLDFGCGTGNYLNAIHTRFGCRCFGVEPSERMRLIAIKKNSQLDIRKGDHSEIPFEDETFDFVYMTDVMHHVPDKPSMFSEISRVMRTGASLCVVTESHEQIDSRFYNFYFPSLGEIEKNRYPDIDAITKLASEKLFAHASVEILPKQPRLMITDDFIRNISEKNWSMFRLLSDTEFYLGLEGLKADIGREFDTSQAGTTLVWFSKSNK